MLGMNVTRDKIECVLFLDGRIRSTIIENAQQGFVSLADWLLKLGVNSVHAFCDVGADDWQEAAAFLKHSGHRLTVLNEAQIRACATVLCTPLEKTRRLAA